ncbi:hypothetical protein ACET3Z_012201 [Daucus carota]
MSGNDRCTNYATLSFSEVAPGFYHEECGGHTSNLDYANEKADAECCTWQIIRIGATNDFKNPVSKKA